MTEKKGKINQMSFLSLVNQGYTTPPRVSKKLRVKLANVYQVARQCIAKGYIKRWKENKRFNSKITYTLDKKALTLFRDMI